MDFALFVVGIIFAGLIVYGLLHYATRMDIGFLKATLREQTPQERAETLGRIMMYKPGDYGRAMKALEELSQEESALSNTDETKHDTP